MKIAFYIEDGLEQIVLTPKAETEIALLARLHDESRDFTLYQGEFYACQGGWTRHGSGDRSTIIVMRPKSAEIETPAKPDFIVKALVEALHNMVALARPHFSDEGQMLALSEADAALTLARAS